MEKNKSVCIANVKLSIDVYSLRCVQPHYNKCKCKKLVCSELHSFFNWHTITVSEMHINFHPDHLHPHAPLFPPLSNFLLWDNMYMIMVNLITFRHSISNLYMIHSKLIHVYAYLYISSFLWRSNAAVESEKLHACKSWNVDVR